MIAFVPMELKIELVPIEALKPHEQYIEKRVLQLMNEIRRDGVLIKPILVDVKTKIILDGHHRVEALKRLGARLVPAILVDYDDDGVVKVTSWRQGEVVTKETVRRAGLSGKLLPPYTSRHILSRKVPEARVPLVVLKRGVPSSRGVRKL